MARLTCDRFPGCGIRCAPRLLARIRNHALADDAQASHASCHYILSASASRRTRSPFLGFVRILFVSMMRRAASCKFARASAIVLPCVFTPGTSSSHARYQSPLFLYAAVNVCCIQRVYHQNYPTRSNTAPPRPPPGGRFSCVCVIRIRIEYAYTPTAPPTPLARSVAR